jgi:hypothetical protein
MSTELHDSSSSGTDRLKALVQAGLRYAAARAQLLHIEALEASVHMRAVMLLLAVVLCAFTGAWLLAVPALIYLAAQQFQISWVALALGCAALHLVVCFIALGLLWKRLSRTRLFAESLNQFQTDRTWLTGNPQK